MAQGKDGAAIGLLLKKEAHLKLLSLIGLDRPFEVEWHVLLALACFTGIQGPHLVEMIRYGGGVAIVELLKRYYDCYELQLVGLHALYGLGDGGQEVVKTLTEAGAAQSVVTIVGSNRDKPQILASACDVLARFARHAPPG